MGSFSLWHWVIVLLVVVLLFGTKKLRNVGADLGASIKSFRKGMADSDADDAARLDSEGKEAGSSKQAESETSKRS